MANRILFLIVFLFSFTSIACAQSRIEEGLKAQQVPSTETTLPKARLHVVRKHTSDPLILYSATAKGLQISEDRGESWQPLAIGGTNEEVFTVTVHTLEPNTLFAGRRDGLWKSNDGGLSWSSMAYPGSVPLSVAIAKNAPNVLYLATSRRGVFKSTDGGQEWAEASKGLPTARAGGRPAEIRTLAVDPTDHDVAYAALARHGIYRTVDGGASWNKFNQGLPFIMGGPIGAPKLAFDSEDPQRLYVVFNLRIHSHLIKTRLYVLSNNDEWRPLIADLPKNIVVQDILVEKGKAVLQIWGPDAVWEVPLQSESRSRP